MVRIINIIVFITVLGLTSVHADTFERVILHLERNGITNGLQLFFKGDILINSTPGRTDELAIWNIELPKPSLEELLPDDVALQFYSIPLKYRRVIPVYPYFELLSDAEKLAVDQAEEAAKQSTKSDALKNAERRVITFLKTEGFIGANDKKFTAEQILAMHATLDLMADQDVADAKRAKYDSLIRRVETAGGTEFDVYEHPIP